LHLSRISNQVGKLVKLSKRLTYSAIRIPSIGLIVLSISSIAALIPAEVSSPGLTFPEVPSVVKYPSSPIETENESFLQLHVVAPMPFLTRTAAQSFNRLREAVINGAGFDFLATCGDMLRVGGAKPKKLGAVFNSRHKKGEAFDYNQEDPRVLLVREYGNSGLQWRTYLLCQSQDGSLGTKAKLYTDNVGWVSAYVFDFTAAAEQFGWERISAQPGWSKGPTKKEFWHYQLRREGSIQTEPR
jgi:hypothetical protein